MAYDASPPPDAPTPPQGSSAVFVDASGQRRQRVRWLGVALASLLMTYLVLVAAALVGPPGLSRIAVPGLGPLLPGPGAAPLGDGQGGTRSPREALPSPSSTGDAGGGRAVVAPDPASGSVAGSPSPVAGAPAVPAPAVPTEPSRPAAPGASASPRPAPAATTPPGRDPERDQPTGQPSSRPTPTQKPSPGSTGNRPSEQPSPGTDGQGS